MKYKEILDLYQNLQVLNLKGVKFSYGVAKNIAMLKTEVDSLIKSQEASKEFQEYDKERIALAEKLADKDANGKAIVNTETKQYQVIENLAEFNKGLEELKAKHSSAFEEREKQIKDFNELIEKECASFVPYKIALADVPSEISTQEMAKIFSVIE